MPQQQLPLQSRVETKALSKSWRGQLPPVFPRFAMKYPEIKMKIAFPIDPIVAIIWGILNSLYNAGELKNTLLGS